MLTFIRDVYLTRKIYQDCKWVINKSKKGWDFTANAISKNFNKAKHWIYMNYKYYFDYQKYCELKKQENLRNLNNILLKEQINREKYQNKRNKYLKKIDDIYNSVVEDHTLPDILNEIQNVRNFTNTTVIEKNKLLDLLNNLHNEEEEEETYYDALECQID